MMGSLTNWEGFNKIKPIATEMKVWNEEHKYQGTLDLIAKIGRRLVLVDWKSGSGIYADMGMQLVAYAKAYEEMTGICIKRGLIVLVGKDKPNHTLIAKEFRLNKSVFKKFLKLRYKLPEVSECDEQDVTDLPSEQTICSELKDFGV